MSEKLVEVQPFQYEILSEAKKRPGVLMVLEGVFQRADTQNANRRIYPRALWNKIMADEDTKDRLESRRMLGELDHPASGATSTHRVSHVITEHKLLPNGEVRGTMEILDTPAGRIAETLFKAGVQLGVSSRGDGSVERKGETSEVQDDYRLETYDLVLKPSTPGAYPSIIESEEEARKNNELIAEAVEGLVKSTTDVDVLLECHKLITVLEAGPRCDAILKDLKSKLSGPDPRVAHPEESEPKVTEETNDMSGANKNQSPELSPEMAAFLKEQVDRGIADAVKAKDDKISELNEMIVELTTNKEDLEGKLEAATKLVDEFQRTVDELKEEKTDNTDLQDRYDAACKLLDEAVEKLQDLGDTQRRLEASNSLLAVSIGRHKEESVNRKVDELISDLDEDVQKKLRPFLQECDNAAEVQAKFDDLASLVESVRPEGDSKEPLPTRQNRSGALNEQTRKPAPQTKHSNFVTSRLLNRMSGVA